MGLSFKNIQPKGKFKVFKREVNDSGQTLVDIEPITLPYSMSGTTPTSLSGTSLLNWSDASGSDGEQQYQTFGNSIALSSDGNTLIVGCHRYNSSNGDGAFYIYTWSGTAWQQQYKAYGETVYDDFGSNVSISGDGNTAIVGDWAASPSGLSYAGRVKVYTRSGSTWSLLQTITRPNEILANKRFGKNTSISGDGSVLAIGDINNFGSNGGVHIFKLDNGQYVFDYYIDGTSLNAEWSRYDNLNTFKNISYDGKVLVTFPYGSKMDIYVSNNSSWILQQSENISSNHEKAAISDDANTIVLGDESYSGGVGRVSTYVRNGNTWQPVSDLVGPSADSKRFGVSVAVSGDGSYLVVGSDDSAYGGGFNTGKVYIYSRSGNSWNLEYSGRPSLSIIWYKANFSRVVSISGNGSKIAVSAPRQPYNVAGSTAPGWWSDYGRVFFYS